MKFIMMIGCSGSGKSTLARQISSHDPTAVLLSSDDIIEEMAATKGISYQEGYAAYKDEVAEEVRHRAIEAFAKGVNVIWDQTNLTRAVRLKRLDLVPDSYERIAVALVEDYPTLLKRIQDRRDAGGREIPGHVLRDQIAQLEVPDYDEGFDQIKLVSQEPIAQRDLSPEEAPSM